MFDDDGLSASKVAFSSDLYFDDGDVGVDDDFGKGSSSSKVAFFFDEISGNGGDGMMLQRGLSSLNQAFPCDGIHKVLHRGGQTGRHGNLQLHGHQ